MIFCAVYLALFWAGHLFFSLVALRSQPKIRILSRACGENKRDPYQEAATDPWFADLNHAEELTVHWRHKQLYAYLLRQKTATHRYVLCCHDYITDARFTAPYARGFYQRGYHVLMPDASACGRSQGRVLGLGYGERDEVALWINRILELDPEAEILLFGLGTGAAAELFYCSGQLDTHVCGVISDSCYAGLWEALLAHLLPRLGALSKPIIGFANTENMVFAGTRLHWKKADLWHRISACPVPILLMHGEEDYLFPVKHFEVLQEQITAPLHTLRVPNAGHIALLIEDPNNYWNSIDEFLDSIGIHRVVAQV